MAPKDLPGFYWDDARNRYFPISSLPPGDSRRNPQVAQRQPKEQPQQRKRQYSDAKKASASHSAVIEEKVTTYQPIWHALQSSRASQRQSVRRRNEHHILANQVASTRYMDYSVTLLMPKESGITAFCTTILNNRPHRFLGDSRGLVSSYEPACDPDDGSGIRYMPPHWTNDFHLGSKITALCVAGHRLVATSFGPQSRILVRDLSHDEASRTTLITPPPAQLHDVWTASLHGKRLVLGMGKRAVWLNDIDTSSEFGKIDTGSDVFALCQRDNVVLTGSRNGAIARFDLRTPQGHQQGHPMFTTDAYHKAFKHSAITELRTVREWELVVSTINGDLTLRDERFPRASAPVVTFDGHKNSYRPKLGLAVDPTESFLFAAGDDNAIRGWSLHTGQPLLPPQTTASTSNSLPSSTLPSTPTKRPQTDPQELHPPFDLDLAPLQPPTQNPFAFKFKEPVLAMDVSWERAAGPSGDGDSDAEDEGGEGEEGEEGMILWASSANRLHQFFLGRFDEAD